MDFLKGTKNSDLAVSPNKFALFDTYSTYHRAEVYATTLKRSGKQTKIVDKGEEFQLWYKD